MEGLAQVNIFLIRSKSSVMGKFVKLTTAMRTMQAQLKTIPSSATKTAKQKYCWRCRRNFSHGSNVFLTKKARHKDEANYKNYLGTAKIGVNDG